MNWGKGVAITLTLFISFIMYMVIQQMSMDIDLESEDYYTQEINYSSELKAINRDKKFVKRPTISQNESHLIIQFPEDFELKGISVRLRRANDKKEDKEFPVKGTNMFIIDKNDLKKGGYQVVISYKINDELYIQKKEIII